MWGVFTYKNSALNLEHGYDKGEWSHLVLYTNAPMHAIW